MKDLPRRRRLEYDGRPPSGGGMPIVPLVIVVILLGLLLGGVLHHFMGNGSVVAVPTPFPSVTPLARATPLAASPTPLPTSSTTPKPTPKKTRKASSKPSPSVTPSASAVIIITPAPSASGSATPQVTQTHVPVRTAAPKPLRSAVYTLSPPPTLAPPTPAAPSGGSAGATAAVRAYLGALARGDESTATSYLSKGLPSETFMNASAHINSIESTKNANGSYTVTADVTTASGEYFSTFTVEHTPFGMQITDHYTIRPR